jgi:hypothetical protein
MKELVFIERTGTYCPPVLCSVTGEKKVKILDNEPMRFNGHNVTFQKSGLAVAILNTEIVVKNPLPCGLSLWDETTKSLSPIRDRKVFIEVGQGIFTLPVWNETGFLLWTLTLT